MKTDREKSFIQTANRIENRVSKGAFCKKTKYPYKYYCRFPSSSRNVTFGKEVLKILIERKHEWALTLKDD